jgi:putative FmdB family regulatory protein
VPLYEYRCRKCGALSEKIQKFSDAPLTRCEKCGGRLERLISPPTIQFKGSGWYVTDYARKGSGESSRANGGSSVKPDGASGESKKTEAPAATKPAAPSPASRK